MIPFKSCCTLQKKKKEESYSFQREPTWELKSFFHVQFSSLCPLHNCNQSRKPLKTGGKTSGRICSWKAELLKRFVYSHSMVLQSMCTQGNKGVCLYDHVAYCLHDLDMSDQFLIQKFLLFMMYQFVTFVVKWELQIIKKFLFVDHVKIWI